MTIDDDLLNEARQLAVRSRRSLGDIVDDALRVLLATRREAEAAPDLDLPVFGGSGLRPGVDLEDKDGLSALLDQPDQDGAATGGDGARAAG